MRYQWLVVLSVTNMLWLAELESANLMQNKHRSICIPILASFGFIYSPSGVTCSSIRM